MCKNTYQQPCCARSCCPWPLPCVIYAKWAHVTAAWNYGTFKETASISANQFFQTVHLKDKTIQRFTRKSQSDWWTNRSDRFWEKIRLKRTIIHESSQSSGKVNEWQQGIWDSVLFLFLNKCHIHELLLEKFPFLYIRIWLFRLIFICINVCDVQEYFVLPKCIN